MDLRVYYQNIRQIEAEIAEPFAVIVSRETLDGGRAGMKSDVPRALAAKLVAEGKAELASTEITVQFRAQTERRRRSAEEERGSGRVPSKGSKPCC